MDRWLREYYWFRSGPPPSFWSSPLLWFRSLITPLTDYERLGLERTAQFRTKWYGYVSQQSTKPQTLGYSLADSPVGLLAWIYEKLITWTDDYPWTDDESKCNDFTSWYDEILTISWIGPVLNWISIYYFSRPGPAASVRIYAEALRAGDWARRPYVPIPSGLSFFRMELQRMPKLYVDHYNDYILKTHNVADGDQPWVKWFCLSSMTKVVILLRTKFLKPSLMTSRKCLKLEGPRLVWLLERQDTSRLRPLLLPYIPSIR